MKKLIVGSIFSILLFVINACKKEYETVSLSADSNYYPDDSGYYVIYKVDSIVYNDFYWNKTNNTPSPGYQRNSSYFLKEMIDEQFIDNLGRTARKVKRFITDDTILHPFAKEETNVWYMVKNNRNVEKIEENVRYIKLTFPSIVNNDWKGNKYFIDRIPFAPLKNNNTGFNWTYTITDKDIRYSNGFTVFDSTLTVLQDSDSSVVHKSYSEEKFARNVGLVYKELWRLDAQPIEISRNPPIIKPFLQSQLNGFIVRQYALRYGKL